MRWNLVLYCRFIAENENQKTFEKMIIMKYDCVGIGVVKMTVGVRRRAQVQKYVSKHRSLQV